jgi:hypothetical protein
MFQPLEPLEFCQRWVPKKKKINLDEYGYKKACAELLAELTGYQESSVRPWLFAPERVPLVVKRYLRAVDKLWQLEELLEKVLKVFQDQS